MPLIIATPRTIASAVRTVRTLRPSRLFRAKRVTARDLVHRLGDLVLGRALELPDDQPVGEVEDAVGDRRGSRLVGDHHDRLAELLDGVPEQLEDLAARLRVEVARRLVREHDGRLRDERPRDRDALLLAARELRGSVGGRSPSPTEAMSSSKHARSGFSPAIESGSVMFSSAVSIGRRLKNWKTKPMWFAPQLRQVGVLERRDLRAGDRDRARRSACRAPRGCASGSTCPSPTGP